MWSFATHAGAGMAIAGLTATYYALSRRNYQGDRERVEHESGFGDGPQVNRLRKHGEIGQLTSSHMLLKKELEELSFLNGSSSGLNILYQQKNPLHRFHRSNFEITPIVSRVDMQDSQLYLNDSNEDIGSSAWSLEIFPTATTTGAAAGDESSFGSDPNVDNASHVSVTLTKDTESDELPVMPIDIEKRKTMEAIVNVDEIGAGDVTAVAAEEMKASSSKSNTDNANPTATANTTSNDSEGESVSAPRESSASVGEKWKVVQDNQFLKRTASPICFFKNPGFGNRYAVNVKKEKSSPLVATLSSSNINGASEEGNLSLGTGKSETVPVTPSSQDCQNSTQFLFTPALSQSNVSVCEADNPEKMLKRKKIPVKATDADKTVDTNPVEEMSEYNKKLFQSKAKGIRQRVDPANSNLYPPQKIQNQMVLISPPSEVDRSPCEEHESQNVSESKPNFDDSKLNANESKPEVDENSYVDSDSPEDNCKNNNNEPVVTNVETEEDASKVLLEEIDFETPPVPPICEVTTRPSSLVTNIPPDSWIALPVRLYANSRTTIPWSLIGLCVVVVMIAGFLGTFLSRLANNVQRKYQQDKML